MNPQVNTNNSIAPLLMQDIRPPYAPQPAAPEAELVQTEIAHNIPIRLQSQPVNVPLATHHQPLAPVTDQVEAKAKKSFFGKLFVKKPRPTPEAHIQLQPLPAPAPPQVAQPQAHQPKVRNPKPILIITLAFLVGLGLTVAAIYSFKQAHNNQSPGSVTQTSGL